MNINAIIFPCLFKTLHYSALAYVILYSATYEGKRLADGDLPDLTVSELSTINTEYAVSSISVKQLFRYKAGYSIYLPNWVPYLKRFEVRVGIQQVFDAHNPGFVNSVTDGLQEYWLRSDRYGLFVSFLYL